jgi:hypothetical protein
VRAEAVRVGVGVGMAAGAAASRRSYHCYDHRMFLISVVFEIRLGCKIEKRKREKIQVPLI